MGKRLDLTDDDVLDMQELYDSGTTIKHIAARYGISCHAVQRRIDTTKESKTEKRVPYDFARKWNEARFRLLES